MTIDDPILGGACHAGKLEATHRDQESRDVDPVVGHRAQVPVPHQRGCALAGRLGYARW